MMEGKVSPTMYLFIKILVFSTREKRNEKISIKVVFEEDSRNEYHAQN